MTAQPDYYQVLGVRSDAPDVVVRAAYRILSLQYHPDRNGDPEKMVAINAAYAVLSDPVKRRAYDQSRTPAAATRRDRLISSAHTWIDKLNAWDLAGGKPAILGIIFAVSYLLYVILIALPILRQD